MAHVERFGSTVDGFQRELFVLRVRNALATLWMLFDSTASSSGRLCSPLRGSVRSTLAPPWFVLSPGALPWIRVERLARVGFQCGALCVHFGRCGCIVTRFEFAVGRFGSLCGAPWPSLDRFGPTAVRVRSLCTALWLRVGFNARCERLRVPVRRFLGLLRFLIPLWLVWVLLFGSLCGDPWLDLIAFWLRCGPFRFPAQRPLAPHGAFWFICWPFRVLVCHYLGPCMALLPPLWNGFCSPNNACG